MACLSLELEALIFSYMQLHDSLNLVQITRLLHYTFTPLEMIIKAKTRKLWTKEEFLNYIIFNNTPFVEAPISGYTTTEPMAKKRRL